MITQRLIEILDELRGVIKQQEIKVSNDVLFEQACGFLRGEYASQKYSKVNGCEVIPPTVQASPLTALIPLKEEGTIPSFKLATAKQWAYVQSLADKLEIDLQLSKNLTTREISAIINDLETKRRKQK